MLAKIQVIGNWNYQFVQTFLGASLAKCFQVP
jgi:hypothetical protein